MHISKPTKNVGTQHLRRGACENKNKNFFELTDSIPRTIFYENENNFEWNISYAELLIKVLEKHDILDKIEIEFSESDCIEYLLYILESHVQLIENQISYNDLKNNIDSKYDNWTNPISIYYENAKNGKLKSIFLGIPDIEPDFICGFFLKDISLFKNRKMRIGYAHFIRRFLKLTPNILTHDAMDYYLSLNESLEMYEGVEVDDEDDWIVEFKSMEKNIKKREPQIQKIFQKFDSYLLQDYSEFLNYRPRDPKIKKIYDAMLFCIETLSDSFYSKFRFSNYGLDDGCIDFERLFRVLPEDNEIASFEFDQINHQSQEGVVPLESILKITKSKINSKERKENQELFKTLTKQMSIISQYLYNKKDATD